MREPTPALTAAALVAVAFTLIVVTAACEPLADGQDYVRAEVPIFVSRTPPPVADPGSPPRLRVMAWNIKYAAARIPFWFDCWGDRLTMSEAEVLANLEALAKLIDEVQPDVLLLEEIEVGSKRSAYVDMVRWLLERGPFSHAAYFQTWQSRFIPAEGLGRMDLGNAILSRYPIVRAERIRQPDRTDQDALTATFYIHRAVGRAELALPGGQNVAAFVVHTEAYDQDGTKQRQIVQIRELVDAEPLPWVLGGDFNELPPTALRTVGFPDERETALCSDDFVQPPYTPEVLAPYFAAYVPWIPLDRFGTTDAEQARYFTHSVLGPDERNESGDAGDWNRTVDYLFVRPPDAWLSGTTDVLQRAGQRLGGDSGVGPVLVADPLRLSDHAPVVGVWELR